MLHLRPMGEWYDACYPNPDLVLITDRCGYLLLMQLIMHATNCQIFGGPDKKGAH
ncbi:hypothetical protein BS50DRAFT_318963 [Corynespora cassiicola Philippines]|uniref:Uncharacterized protein n=1 Tax=Corynespora cassiicola Philippines TaxID=1448308 RepID=A0A2T2N0I9_CORCC|nr:hypothetical protein BS50DRAFT_318963 [Corynespora cassiicola Philippines]